MATALLCAALGGALAQPQPETRGQAELIARREAVDSAVRSLRLQAAALETNSGVSLARWLTRRSDRVRDFEQVLRGAPVAVDEATDGLWEVRLELPAADLGGALRVTLVDQADTVLVARGRADVGWGGGGSSTSNLPSDPAPEADPWGEPEIVPDREHMTWTDRAALSAAGLGTTSRSAEQRALEALARALRDLPVSEASNVADWERGHPARSLALAELLAAARRTDRRFLGQAGYTVEVEVDLDSLLAAITSED